MRKSFFISYILILGAVLFPALRGVHVYAAQEDEAGILRLSTTDVISTLDVHKTTEYYMGPLNIYERLFDVCVKEDGTGDLVNGLAEDYSVSDDGLTYRFTLREDAYFSDGTPVKASDVAFTFSRMLSLPGSVQTDFADMILGAEEVMDGRADVPEGITVVDDRHISITLSEPFAGYLYQLAAPSCSILSEDFVTQAGSAFGTSADQTMGSGPYMVSEYSRYRIVFEKNPYYHCHDWESLSASKVEFLMLPPALTYQEFEKGNLDILDTSLINPDSMENILHSDKWAGRLIACSKVDIQYIMLNVEKPPLNDVRIRRAIQMAIDRQGIVDRLYGGWGRLTDGIFPEGLIGYSEENQGWLEYDPQMARELVSEVGRADEIRIELAANSASATRRQELLQMIRQDLEAAGLKTSIVIYDADSWLYLRNSGALMAYASEWSADFNDPDNFIYTFFGSSAKTAYRSSNYSDQRVIRRIAGARSMQDTEKRMEEYAALEKRLIQDDAVWVPLFSTEHLFVLGDRIESFRPFWAGWSSMYFRDIVLRSCS